MRALLGWVLGEDIDRTVLVYALVLLRTLPLAWLAPWLGVRGTAAALRVAIAAVLAAAVTPLAMMHAPEIAEDPFAFALLGLREALIGATFAIAASVPLYALHWTGNLLDGLRTSGTPTDRGPLGVLHLLVGVVAFVLLGGHRLAIGVFARGLTRTPPGAAIAHEDLAAFGLGAAQLVGDAIALTLAFALPAIVAFLLLEFAFGYASRVAPTLRTWLFGMPLRALLGVSVALITLSALVPRLGAAYGRSIDAASRLLDTLGS